jgi:hypothetical protein
MGCQLSLFESDRYFDPRIGADRARARSLAKLRPVRRCQRQSTPKRSGTSASGLLEMRSRAKRRMLTDMDAAEQRRAA